VQQAEDQEGRERTGTISYVKICRVLEWPGKTQNTSPSTEKHGVNMWPNVSLTQDEPKCKKDYTVIENVNKGQH